MVAGVGTGETELVLAGLLVDLASTVVLGLTPTPISALALALQLELTLALKWSWFMTARFFSTVVSKLKSRTDFSFGEAYALNPKNTETWLRERCSPARPRMKASSDSVHRLLAA